MCGITGWINSEQNITQHGPVVENMVRTLTPRGPDAEGFWTSPHAILGHRRLVVVDPSGGQQPMVRKRGENTYVLVYNGELYNTHELREQLAAKGYRYEGHSDTEVLLTAYMEWGEECVKHFNGIYAFALWEEKTQTLFMARDRFGVKPLFYAQRGRSFVFGSELKALLAHPEIEPEVECEGLSEIFVLGPSRSPGHGVFRNVFEVKPGHSLLLIDNRVTVKKYWSLESREHPDDLQTTITNVRILVEDAIRRQLVADVPVCTLLSGGLDSSTLTAFAARAFQEEGRGPLHSFSVDYEGNDQHFQANKFEPTSDAPWVKLVSDRCKTNHHYIKITTSELVNSLPEAVLARDLPGMADIDSSLLLFCREIKKVATVAQSGECADEVFGGYPWYRDPETLKANSFPWLRSLDQRKKLYSPELLSLIQPEAYIARRYEETIAEIPRLPGENPEEARRREMFYLNFSWFMATLLDRKDRMSMATGLEVRVPFCDHRIVEYVWNIPWQMKTVGQMEKGLLRRALKGVVPDEILNRRKSPYPKTHNPAYLAALKDWLLEIIGDSSSPLLPLIDVTALRKMLAAGGETFDQPWFGQLMKGPQLLAFLIQTDTWLRTYKVSIS